MKRQIFATLLVCTTAALVLVSPAVAQMAPVAPAVPQTTIAPVAAAPVVAAPVAANPDDPVALGKAIAFDRGKGNCLACHMIEGGSLMGNVGPALKDMKVVMPDSKQLYAVIYNEQARNPSTVMPAFGRNGILTPEEIKDVVAYLYTK